MAAPSLHISTILKVFNLFHKRLQFIIEYMSSNTISFLDTLLIINENRLEFNWYHKPTFSGRFLNFLSYHPISHKIGVVMGLVDKTFHLSHPKFHEKNLSFVINILLENSYPLQFIHRIILRRLKSLIHNRVSHLTTPLPSVYKIFCRDCDASYVGQTGRRLTTRLKEHKSMVNYSSESYTVVSSHRLLGHDFNWEDTTILDEEPCYRKRLVSEMLHISQ